MKKIYLIDGMSLVFRAYHAMSSANLKTPEGIPTGALFGFTNIITSLLERESPEYLAVVFDRSEPTFRHEMYPEYKANRDAFPEELVPQLPLIKELLDKLSVPRFEMARYEADDIIGSVAKKFGDSDTNVLCVTSDKDYYQLVDDNIKVFKPGLRGEDFQLIDYEQVNEKFGVHPAKVIDVMALIGDAVDNIPGVKGIGEKTAIPLIQKYGSLEELYNHLEEIDKKSVKSKLEENREMAFLSRTLVTIHTTMDLDYTADDLKVHAPDFDQLDDFFKRVGFNTLRIRWKEKALKYSGLFPDGKKTEIKETKELSDIKTKYNFVNNNEKFESLIQRLQNSDLISFDLETDSLDRDNCEIVGIALSVKEGEGYYIPVEYFHKTEEPVSTNLFDRKTAERKWADSLDVLKVLEKLKPVLENKSIGKCGQNSKFDMYILKKHGIEVTPLVFDTMVASYLLDPDQKHNLDALSRRYLNYSPIPISKLIGEKKSAQISMRDVPPVEICDYACEDADLALKLKNILNDELRKEGLTKLADDIEFPMVEVLTQMEIDGVTIDKKSLAEISVKLDGELKRLSEEIFHESGTVFNIDSPKQLGEILFEKMNIPPLKKNKTGYSTDIQVLTELSVSYPFVSKILDYRHYGKLKSTYIDALPKLVNQKTGRIHTTYNQTVASTGRLSSTDPNLQNIPIRTDMGKEIRKAFVPVNDNYVILSADYSQIELRIMAYICNDDKMIDGFKHGLDIHSATASLLFGIDINQVDSDKRRIAKTVNFGIMYGLGSFGLSQRLGIPRKESKEIIDNYFKKYPGIRKYMEITIEETRKKGYAETLCGRRRFFPDITSKNNNLRTAAERGAINMPIQGTASDMLKIAMIGIYEEFKRMKLKTKMIMQVHDELVFEVLKSEIEQAQSIIIDKMTNAVSLGEVPVIVDTGTGNNWFEAH